MNDTGTNVQTEIETGVMKQKTIDPRTYPLQVRPLSEDEGGGYLASVPDLPGCMGDGETEAAAIEDARAAIASWVETAEKFGDPVPEPNAAASYSGKFVTRIPKSLHMTLAETARREGVSLNQFVLTKLAEAVGGNQARK